MNSEIVPTHSTIYPKATYIKVEKEEEDSIWNIGHKLLLADELPQGALARYERDIAAIAYVVGKKGKMHV